MNRRQKIIVSVTGIFLVLLILVGLTYGYFLTRIDGNNAEKSISVTTADLRLIYGGDNGNIIGGENLFPSDTEYTKTFTVYNDGSVNTKYGVFLIDVINTFVRKDDIKYTLSCTTDGTLPCGTASSTTFPSGISEIVTAIIEPKKTHTYTFKFTYKDTGTDQSVDMGKELSAKIQIFGENNKGLIIPYENNTLAYNIINNASNNLNGTKYVETSTTEIGNFPLYASGEYSDDEITLPKPFSPGYAYSSNKETFLGGDYEGAAEICSANLIDKYIGDDLGKYYGIITGCDGDLFKYKSDIVYTNELAKETDDYGISYYYRGDVEDNYVNFNGMCWKIIRIQGDGSIKLLLEDKNAECDDKETINTLEVYTGDRILNRAVYGYEVEDEKYKADFINYTGEDGANVILNNWLTNDFSADSRDKLKDNVWCIGNLKDGFDYNGNIIGQVDELKAAGTEFFYSSAVKEQFSLVCDATGLVEGETYKSKIGMLTLDEYIFAGHLPMDDPAILYSRPKYDFKQTYIYSDDSKNYNMFLLLSLGNFYGYNDHAIDAEHGYFDFIWNVNQDDNIRPVVVLDFNTIIENGGVGTIDNPYVIE